MAKPKITVSLAPYVLEQLEEEAKLQGRSPGDLASFYLEYALERKGLLPAKGAQMEAKEVWEIIKKSVQGQKLNDCELAIIAEHFNEDQKALKISQ